MNVVTWKRLLNFKNEKNNNNSSCVSVMLEKIVVCVVKELNKQQQASILIVPNYVVWTLIGCTEWNCQILSIKWGCVRLSSIYCITNGTDLQTEWLNIGIYFHFTFLELRQQWYSEGT